MQKVRKIRKLLHKFNFVIEEMEREMTVPVEMIDVVKEVRESYKNTPKLPKNKEKTHILIPMKKANIEYEEEMMRLQLELVKLQKYIVQTGKKILIIFEGRDAAGKGGTIQRFTENLNPRNHRVVALPKPSDVEK